MSICRKRVGTKYRLHAENEGGSQIDDRPIDDSLGAAGPSARRTTPVSNASRTGYLKHGIFMLETFRHKQAPGGHARLRQAQVNKPVKTNASMAGSGMGAGAVSNWTLL